MTYPLPKAALLNKKRLKTSPSFPISRPSIWERLRTRNGGRPTRWTALTLCHRHRSKRNSPYTEQVPEVAEEPNYTAAFDSLQ